LQRSAIARDVNKTIKKLNEQVRGFSNYFNVSKQCRISLKTLTNYTFIRFRKILFWKFKSKSKTRTFVSNHFIKKGTICNKNQVLLQYENIRPYGLRDITFAAKSKKYYQLNLYLDSVEINNNNFIHSTAEAFSLWKNNKPLSRVQLELLLLKRQDYICIICKHNINIEQEELEIDHNPSI